MAVDAGAPLTLSNTRVLMGAAEAPELLDVLPE